MLVSIALYAFALLSLRQIRVVGMLLVHVRVQFEALLMTHLVILRHFVSIAVSGLLHHLLCSECGEGFAGEEDGKPLPQAGALPEDAGCHQEGDFSCALGEPRECLPL